jgi:hypothetical protein
MPEAGYMARKRIDILFKRRGIHLEDLLQVVVFGFTACRSCSASAESIFVKFALIASN